MLWGLRGRYISTYNPIINGLLSHYKWVIIPITSSIYQPQTRVKWDLRAATSRFRTGAPPSGSFMAQKMLELFFGVQTPSQRVFGALGWKVHMLFKGFNGISWELVETMLIPTSDNTTVSHIMHHTSCGSHMFGSRGFRASFEQKYREMKYPHFCWLM